MALIVTVRPAEWRRTLDQQLTIAPGVWHWTCAPQAVRQYAPVVMGEIDELPDEDASGV